MRLQNYSTAGINITQGLPRGGCTVGFIPRMCMCVCVCVCVYMIVCVYVHAYVCVNVRLKKKVRKLIE